MFCIQCVSIAYAGIPVCCIIDHSICIHGMEMAIRMEIGFSFPTKSKIYILFPYSKGFEKYSNDPC